MSDEAEHWKKSFWEKKNRSGKSSGGRKYSQESTKNDRHDLPRL